VPASWYSTAAIRLEKITAAQLPQFFNAGNDNNTFDNRSDDKGPEPEGVAVGVIGGRTYAFVGLERIGGFMVYDVTDPARPQFVEYTNNRNFEGDPEAGTAGDLGPEGLVFIPAGDSPTGGDLLVVANEVSGTTSVYGITKKQAVTGFTLVDAGKGRDIGPLADGAVIDYAQLGALRLNVRAEVSPIRWAAWCLRWTARRSGRKTCRPTPCGATGTAMPLDAGPGHLHADGHPLRRGRGHRAPPARRSPSPYGDQLGKNCRG
jgi:hypothetical protein